MIDSDWIKQCVESGHYRYSRHADRERQNDALSLDEIEQAVLTGRIILKNTVERSKIPFALSLSKGRAEFWNAHQMGG